MEGILIRTKEDSTKVPIFFNLEDRSAYLCVHPILPEKVYEYRMHPKVRLSSFALEEYFKVGGPKCLIKW